MQPDHLDEGLSGRVHDDGRVELFMWAGGKCVHSFEADHKVLGRMATGLLTMAYQSARRTGAKPANLSGSHPDNPSIPISACAPIVSKEKKTFALGFVLGKAQIAFQIPQSTLARLGRQLLAASAPNDRPQ